MKFSQILLSALIGAVVALGAAHLGGGSGPAASHKETAYERVMRTGTLRCGYIPYSYLYRIDPNTKERSGVFYDVMMELGRLNQLNIDWAEELTWGTIVEAIRSGRVDAFCSGQWIDTQNGRFLAFSDPLFYNAVSAYGRAEETRFTNLQDIDSPKVRVVTRDGGTPAIIARQDFPHATVVSLPSGVSDGELVEYVQTGKADVFFYSDDYLAEYMAANPGKMKDLFPGKKLRIYATAIALPMEDVALKNLINNSLTELKGSKVIEKALTKNAPAGSWLKSTPDGT